MKNFFDHVEAHALVTPEKPAIILIDRFITYRMLANGIQSVSNAIADRNLDRDAPVGLMLDSPSWHLIASLALLKRGLASFSFYPGATSAGIGFDVKDVISSSRFHAPGVRVHVMTDDWFGNPAGRTVFDHSPNRVARVSFTSGSTGKYKPIAHTQKAVLSNAAARIMFVELAHQRVLNLFGLNTFIGFSLSIATFLAGATLCLTASGALALIGHVGVTMLAGSPLQITSMAGEARDACFDLSSVRQISIAGGMATHPVLSQIREAFSAEIVDDYGATEAPMVGVARGRLLAQRASGVIRFAPLADIRIEPLEAGSREGRIGVRTELAGLPFDGRLDFTDADVDLGFVYSNDIGFIDDEGCLVLLGRADEVINQGGVKLEPEAIEAVLMKNPDIQDVAIVGQIDITGVGHEAWCAYVADRDLPLEQLTAWLRNHNRPVTLHRLVRVESIPRDGGMGKVSRPLVRQIFTGRDSRA